MNTPSRPRPGACLVRFLRGGPTVALVASLLLTGCLGGWSLSSPPRADLTSPPVRNETLHYRFSRSQTLTIGDGESGARAAIRERAPFRQVKYQHDKPNKGLWMNVRAVFEPPNPVSLYWAYVDAAVFLGLLPAFLWDGGYRLKFDLYRDGGRVARYEYKAEFWIFGWLPLLPIAWISALTPTEYETFYAAAERFFAEAHADGAFDAVPPTPEPSSGPPPDPKPAVAPPEKPLGCGRDTDCKGDRICVAGECRSPDP